jgi:hypothetical protein
VRPAGGARPIVEHEHLKPDILCKPLRAGLKHCALEKLAALRPLARGGGDHNQQGPRAAVLSLGHHRRPFRSQKI